MSDKQNLKQAAEQVKTAFAKLQQVKDNPQQMQQAMADAKRCWKKAPRRVCRTNPSLSDDTGRRRTVETTQAGRQAPGLR